MLLPYKQDAIRRSRIHPNYFLRAEWHDYTSRCVYMITFLKSENAPVFSNIRGQINPQGLHARYEKTEIGEIIYRQIKRLDSNFNFVSVVRYVIMPDHVHILLNVKEKSQTHLGDIVGSLKKECAREYKHLYSEAQCNSNPLFLNGYNDKIVFRPGQYEGYKKYIEDNPRRYFIRTLCPEFFKTWRNFRIGDKQVSLYGNFELLRKPCKSVVRFSRKFSDGEWEERKDEYDRTISQEGVLVSPFIHHNEKDIKTIGIERGASIIRIVNNGYSDRYKPGGIEFDLCAEGRLLLIAPVEYNFRKTNVRRQECLEMNELAEIVANLTYDTEIRMRDALPALRAKI